MNVSNACDCALSENMVQEMLLIKTDVDFWSLILCSLLLQIIDVKNINLQI